MSRVEAYFDESYGEKVGSILCVAGYLMTDRSARRMTREWNAVLRAFELPYFRMSACAHGNYPFDKLSLAQRVAVQTKLIDLIKRRTITGIALTVDVDEFSKIMPQNAEIVGSAYSFCLHTLLAGVLHWAISDKYEGKLAYFFEAGHNNQSEAQRILSRVFSNKNSYPSKSYAGHGFLRKEDSPPTQAADLLAWQWYTELRHRLEGKKQRKDCTSLLQHRHDLKHVDADYMHQLARTWDQIQPG